jgi:integration host factor subunit alpha
MRDHETATRRDLARAVAKQVDLTKDEVKRVIDLTLKEIIKCFKRGKWVELRGFGTFYPFTRKGRTFVNPRTQEPAETKDVKTLRFRASKHIEEEDG